MKVINKISIISVILLITLGISLIGINIVKNSMNDNIEYTYATKITTYNDIDTYGMFIRDEEIIDQRFTDLSYLTLSNGEKVAKGDAVALNYSDEKFLDYNLELKNLTIEKDLLLSAGTTTDDSSESTKTAFLINDKIADLNYMLDSSDVSDTLDVVSNIKNMALKSSYSQMSKDEIAQNISQVDSEIAVITELVNNQTSTIYSPNAGYFIYGIDGYEDITSEDIDVSYMEDLKDKTITLNQNSTAKIVRKSNWEMAVLVDTDMVEDMKKAEKLRIYLENISEKEILVDIVSVSTDGDKSVVFLKSNFINSDILQNRITDVKIILRQYDGIKIPKEATRIKDGVLGVYSLRGNQAVFIEITPIFEEEDYYLIDFDSIDLIVGDKIITNSKQLTDNQIIK